MMMLGEYDRLTMTPHQVRDRRLAASANAKAESGEELTQDEFDLLFREWKKAHVQGSREEFAANLAARAAEFAKARAKSDEEAKKRHEERERQRLEEVRVDAAVLKAAERVAEQLRKNLPESNFADFAVIGPGEPVPTSEPYGNLLVVRPRGVGAHGYRRHAQVNVEIISQSKDLCHAFGMRLPGHSVTSGDGDSCLRKTIGDRAGVSGEQWIGGSDQRRMHSVGSGFDRHYKISGGFYCVTVQFSVGVPELNS